MSHFIAPKSIITVNGIELTGYKSELGDWVISIRQTALVLKLDESKVRKMLTANWLKLALGAESKVRKMLAATDGGTQKIVAIDTTVFNQIVLHEYASGNIVALTLVPVLMTQALDIRFEGTLTPDLSYSKVEAKALTVKEARKESVEYHQGFVNWYKACGYHGRWSHEYLTKRLADLTASDARKLPLCAGDNCKIGLDHYQETHAKPLFTIGQVKDILSRQSYRSGETYQDAIDRAIATLTMVC
jgi:hypothetical protein